MSGMIDKPAQPDETIHLHDVAWIGVNLDSGWAFGIGRADGRWLGFAQTNDNVTIFLAISTDGKRGVRCKDECLRRSITVIESSRCGFGGFTDEYFDQLTVCQSVDKSTLEAYYCRTCDELLCKTHEKEKWSDG